MYMYVFDALFKMATNIFENDSDVCRNYPCSPCLKNDKKEQESTKYCMDCKEHFCTTCEQAHGRFTQFRDHVITKPTIVSKDLVHRKDLKGVRKNDKKLDAMGFCCITRGETRYTLLSDYQNDQVIVLDEQFGLVSTIGIPGHPYALCEITSISAVAVTVSNTTKLLLLDVSSDGNATIKQEIEVPFACRGITYVPQEFVDCLVIVSGGDPSGRDKNEKGKIDIYSIDASGADVKLVQVREELTKLDNTTHQLFPRNVAINNTKDSIMITEAQLGVIKMKGKQSITKSSVFNSKFAKTTRGICVNGKDEVFVTGLATKNVLKFASDGTLIGEIVNESHGLVIPLSLHYDNVRNLLLIGSARHDCSFLYVNL